MLDPALDPMSVRENTRLLCFLRYWCDVAKEALWNGGHAPRINLARVDLHRKG
jgi:hypothetical protein